MLIQSGNDRDKYGTKAMPLCEINGRNFRFIRQVITGLYLLALKMALDSDTGRKTSTLTQTYSRNNSTMVKVCDENKLTIHNKLHACAWDLVPALCKDGWENCNCWQLVVHGPITCYSRLPFKIHFCNPLNPIRRQCLWFNPTLNLQQ